MVDGDVAADAVGALGVGEHLDATLAQRPQPLSLRLVRDGPDEVVDVQLADLLGPAREGEGEGLGELEPVAALTNASGICEQGQQRSQDLIVVGGVGRFPS